MSLSAYYAGGNYAEPRNGRLSEQLSLNFARIMDEVGRELGDKTALIFRDRSISWRQLNDRTDALAAALSTQDDHVTPRSELQGWQSGQNHVGLLLLNGNEYLESMIGAYKARWAPVNVNYRYLSNELAYVLNDSGCATLIYHSQFSDRVDEIRELVPGLKHLIQVEDDSGRELLEGAQWYESVLNNFAGADISTVRQSWSGDDLYVCYTGGTTGMPKGVLWRQHDFLVSALGLTRRDGAPFESYDEIVELAQKSNLVALPAPPLMHGAAHWNAMSCFAAGGTVVIQDDPRRFDPANVLDVAQRHSATSLLIVGDPFARPLLDELDARPRDLPNLRHILSGGAVLSSATKRRLLQAIPGVKIIDVLGSTESGRQGVASRSSASTDDGAAFKPSKLATVLNHAKSEKLSPGTGEIGWLAQGGLVPLGYLNDKEKSDATFPTIDKVRYSVAGDRAILDHNGEIELLGRDSATINTGGEKVFAEEVETAVKAHEAVFDAVVCGEASERWGQSIVAVASLRPGETLTLPDLRAHCKTLLADYKAPQGLLIVDEVVRSPSGKADYRWAKSSVESGDVIHS